MKRQSSRAYLHKHRRTMQLLPKAALLFACFLLLSYYAGAQPPPRMHHPIRLDPAKDRQEYRGLTIRLISTVEGHYGFDILQGESLVMHLVNELQPGKPLDKREDAFAAAKGLADQYLTTGKVPPLPQPTRYRQQPSPLPNPVKP